MGSAEENRIDTNPLSLSIPVRAFGWLAIAGSLPLALRLVYEQTTMTWDEGPQMVGFTLAHVYPGVLVFGLLAALCVHVWLLAVIVIWIRRRVSKQASLPMSTWLQFAVLTCVAALFYVPYSSWQFATLEMFGPGHAAANQFTAAASQNQGYLVKAFLRNGVAIDSSNRDGQTALDDACLARQLEMARYLISKGAQLDRSPDCRKVPEFAARMRPLALPAPEDAPQTIFVKP